MIRIGGMTALTTIDFPGRLAAVLFLQGCPWRCDYCHNPHLLPARPAVEAATELDWPRVRAFLENRAGLLDGVVFSGGEPTLQPLLGDAIRVVRRLGYQVALHTGGMYPRRLQTILPELDWVGLDIKAPWHLYDRVTHRPGSGTRILDSLRALQAAGVDFECRTTWHPGLYSEADLHDLADTLRQLGVTRWALQECREQGRPHPLWRTPDLERLKAGFAHFEFRPG